MWDLCKSVIAAWMLVVAVGVVLLLAGCATAEPAKPSFPEDMALICHQGRWVIGSPSAGEVVPLPIRCTET